MTVSRSGMRTWATNGSIWQIQDVNERVLLVEDDPSIREIATLGLSNAGFRVTTAPDGREALVQFRNASFDLVVLDVMLPALDGLEVCREIRRRAACRSSSSPPGATPSTSSSASSSARTTTSQAVRDARARGAGARGDQAGGVGAGGAEAHARRARDRPGRVHRAAGRARARPDGDGVQAPARARAAARPGLHARAAARACLELRLPRRLSPRRRGGATVAQARSRTTRSSRSSSRRCAAWATASTRE